MRDWCVTALDDLRLTLRGLLRAPAFTSVTLLSLALGIGATTTIFSVVHAVVIDPFPYRDPDTLVSVTMNWADGRANWSSYTIDEFVELSERVTVFDGLIASTISDVALTGSGDPERLRGNYVTMNTFDVMGVAPLLGRTIGAGDARPGAPPVAVLGYRFWQTRLGGQSDVVGRQLRLNGTLRGIVGVMPRRFMWRGADVYLPTVFARGLALPGVQTVHVMGRLRPGTATAQVETAIRPVLDDLQRRNPQRPTGQYRLTLESFTETFQSGLRQPLLILLGAVALLLIIACVNVSSLLLARGTTREREMAMRTALGAGHGRLVRLLFTESAVLAVVGASLGVLLARIGLGLVMQLVPPDTIPDESHVTMNGAVLLFSLAVSAASCALFGLYPAWQTARADVMTLLREGGRGSSGGAGHVRVRSGLVMTEVALAVVLLVGASLMMRTLFAMQQVEPGFVPDRVLVMRVPLAETRYPTRERRLQFFDSLLHRVGALPGVSRAAISSSVPIYGGRGSSVEVPGIPVNPGVIVTVHEASAAYPGIIGSRPVAGRLFDDREVATARRVGVVNEAFVQRFFPNGTPLGQTVKLAYLTRPTIAVADNTFEIVGVVRNEASVERNRAPRPAVFVPYTVNGNFLLLVVATALPPQQLERTIRGQVYALDPEQPVTDVRTLARLLEEWTFSEPRFNLVLLGVFSIVGLTLAVVGIYGLVAYTVARQIPGDRRSCRAGRQPARHPRPGDGAGPPPPRRGHRHRPPRGDCRHPRARQPARRRVATRRRLVCRRRRPPARGGARGLSRSRVAGRAHAGDDRPSPRRLRG